MLTATQLRVLDFLIEELSQTGVAPSFVEIAADVGFKSKSHVHRVLTELEERGFIRRLHARRRAIEVIKYPQRLPCAHCHGTGLEPQS